MSFFMIGIGIGSEYDKNQMEEIVKLGNGGNLAI